MDREKLEAEIYDTINEVASNEWAAAATKSLMKLIDEHVKSEVAKALTVVRLEIMKNFGAV